MQRITLTAFCAVWILWLAGGCRPADDSSDASTLPQITVRYATGIAYEITPDGMLTRSSANGQRHSVQLTPQQQTALAQIAHRARIGQDAPLDSEQELSADITIGSITQHLDKPNARFSELLDTLQRYGRKNDGPRK